MARVTRDTGTREPGSREPGPAGDAAPWPELADTAPGPAPDAGPDGKRALISSEEIRSKQYQFTYYRFRFREPGGREITEICRKVIRNDNGEQKISYPVIWEGDIRITGYYLAYEITSGRILRAPDWHLYVTVESTDAEGNHLGHANIPAMDLKQTQAKAVWLDKLGVTFSGRSSWIKEFIAILALRAMREPKLIIQGQGPLWLSDGSPISNGILDHKLVFISSSFIFDTDGKTREITPDLEGIPDTHRYYDLTPRPLITDTEIREGIELFRLAFSECPRYPQIPAAMIGQLMTGFMAAIETRAFSAIMQSGAYGSGKTRYALRWDSVQSRTARGHLTDVKPVIGGDSTGTRVGWPLRVTSFGGFTITIDDVMKSGDSPVLMSQANEKISNMVRSYESGGGAIGGIDPGRNKVVSRERPALHSSIRIMSEIPIGGLSTLDRLIILPHFPDEYGRGTNFDIAVSERLTLPESRELMHRAWSAFVYEHFQRMKGQFTETYEKAQAIIREWETGARTAERYAPLVTGLLMLGEYGMKYGIDLSSEISAGIDALRDNAREQTRANIPLCEQFARDLRAAVINSRIAWVGLPNQDPDNAEAGAYSQVYIDEKITGSDGIERTKRHRPELRNQDMGLMLERGNQVPVPGSRRFGFAVPPRMVKGGPAGDPLTRKWLLAFTAERFAELVKFIGKESGRMYDPNAVMDSLRSEKHGNVARIYWPERNWAHYMDMEWALTPKDESGEE